MNFLSQFVPSESLMKWREPNAYSRKDLSHGRWIGLLIFLMIPSLLIITYPNLGRAGIILASFFMVVGVVAFIRVWFGPGDVVCLKGDHITKATRGLPLLTEYRDIECCNVSSDSYNNIDFSVLKFIMKKKWKYFTPRHVTEVVVPADVSLEQILQILRDKGVTAITEPS
jgi:hypothetical protein